MTSVAPTVNWSDLLSAPNVSEISGMMMNAVPSPSSYSNSSMESQESSNISMASPMQLQLSPHQLIYIQEPVAEEMVGSTYLVVREEPVEKFRFRYKSEMMGTHGSILGRNSDKNRKKSYPSVELCNYNGPALVRCSLYTAHVDETQRTPHTHRLVVRLDNDDKDDPHYIRVSNEVGYVAVFQGMGIIHTAKKHITEELVKKKRVRFLEMQKLKNINACTLSTRDETQIRQEAESEAKRMNLNSVTLCFEAFREDSNGLLHPLCKPVFSKPINNMKSALTGELKICRIDKHVSSCLGGEEVFILVEKVGKKNIKIKFFEVDDEDNEIWYDYGKFSELDVHHQYAIVFRTPPYRDQHIEEQVEVFLQLYRPTDGGCSEPIKFTYRPSEKYGGRSRKRHCSALDHGISAVNEGIQKNFTNGTAFMDMTNTPLDRIINSDPVMVERENEDISQFLDSKDDNLNSQEFKEFMKNFSFSEFWPPMQQQPWNRLGSENGKPPFPLGSDISGKLPIGIGSENATDKPTVHIKSDLNFKPPLFNFGPDDNGGFKLPSLFNVGTENHMGKLFNMGAENQSSKHPYGFLDSTSHFGFQFYDERNACKTEPQTSTAYSELLENLEINDLATDGPREKPLIKNPPVRSKPVKENSPVAKPPAKLEDSSFGGERLKNIKEEFDKGLLMYASDVLAKQTMKQLNDLLKDKSAPQEMRQKVANIFAEGKSETGHGPLHTAILNEQKDLLKQMLNVLGLVQDNQIINHRNFKAQTPLHVAVICDQSDTMKALLAVGADPNAVNSVGDTPLHVAVQNSYQNCIAELLNQDNYKDSEFKPRCDVRNYKGWTPLHLAALQKDLKAVKKLVASGANVNEVDSTCGRTVLHLAAEESCVEIVEYLVKETPVDVNLANYAGNTALHVACVVGGEGSAAIAKVLIDYKADPHKQNYTSRRESVEELGTVTTGGVTIKQEPVSDEDSDDDDDDEGRLRINDEYEDTEGDKELEGQTSFDLAVNNKEILELLKKVEEQTELRSKTPELEVEVKEECDSPISACPIPEENGLFDEETFKKLCEKLDLSKSWVNLAELLDYSFLVPNIRNATSPTKLLLNYADLHGSVNVHDIRHFLEALDEHEAVDIIDLMLASQVAENRP